MAQDVVIQGGLFDLIIRKALSEADDAVTGDKPNLMNMALGRGCWFQWEYTVQIELHTGEVEEDLAELNRLREMQTNAADWTAANFDGDAALQMMGALNELFRLGTGRSLTDNVQSVAISGGGGVTLNWPPRTIVPGTSGTTIGNWADVQSQPDPYFGGRVFQTADGIYFHRDMSTGQLVELPPESIVLLVQPGVSLGVTDADVAAARREIELTIESKTQRSQEKQAQLQDITAALQRWFNFTTNLNERKKRDADTIAGNFH